MTTHPIPFDRPARPVRTAVIGLGYWGPNLVRNLHEHPDADLTWVCDLRKESLDTIGKRYPAVARTTSVDEVLRDATVEAVAIATPGATHYHPPAGGPRAGKPGVV